MPLSANHLSLSQAAARALELVPQNSNAARRAATDVTKALGSRHLLKHQDSVRSPVIARFRIPLEQVTSTIQVLTPNSHTRCFIWPSFVAQEVQLYVAFCVVHVLRVNAPESPYTNSQLHDIFKLIISVFEDLADPSAPHFQLSLSVLETASQVGWWVGESCMGCRLIPAAMRPSAAALAGGGAEQVGGVGLTRGGCCCWRACR
jgi:hypothetical protein